MHACTIRSSDPTVNMALVNEDNLQNFERVDSFNHLFDDIWVQCVQVAGLWTWLKPSNRVYKTRQLIVLTNSRKNRKNKQEKSWKGHHYPRRHITFCYHEKNTRGQSDKISFQKFDSHPESMRAKELSYERVEFHGFMVKFTSGLTAHRLETFILFCSSFLLGRSGTVLYSFVALLVAVRL